MPLTTENFKAAIVRIQSKIEPIGAEMNELDGRLGDGDLGVTLINGFKNMASASEDMPADLGRAFFDAAKAMTAVSGSSFGTLMATALMAAGRPLKGREDVEWSEMADLVDAAQQAMIARGGANLGDKTVLDSLDPIIVALRGLNDPDAQLSAAKEAAKAALGAFVERPNKIGRARVYAEKSVGLPDPGMAAIVALLDCL